MDEYVLTKSPSGAHWTFTTLANYEARISNARAVNHFWGHDGFESTEEVIEYIEENFHISKENIIIK